MRNAEEEFCSTCGAILPLPSTAPAVVKCVLCESQWTINPIVDKLISRGERNYETAVLDWKASGDAENPIVDKICEKCGHGQASYACRQTRSADEGQTVFYTCLKCKHSVVENA